MSTMLDRKRDRSLDRFLEALQPWRMAPELAAATGSRHGDLPRPRRQVRAGRPRRHPLRAGRPARARRPASAAGRRPDQSRSPTTRTCRRCRSCWTRPPSARCWAEPDAPASTCCATAPASAPRSASRPAAPPWWRRRTTTREGRRGRGGVRGPGRRGHRRHDAAVRAHRRAPRRARAGSSRRPCSGVPLDAFVGNTRLAPSESHRLPSGWPRGPSPSCTPPRPVLHRERSVDKELRRFGVRAAGIATVDPRLGDQAERLATRLIDRAAAPAGRRHRAGARRLQAEPVPARRARSSTCSTSTTAGCPTRRPTWARSWRRCASTPSGTRSPAARTA